MRLAWPRCRPICAGASLRAFVGRGLIESCDAKEMLAYKHSGFSVDAGVRIEAHERAALERLLRYCAHPLPWTACAKRALPGVPLRQTAQRTWWWQSGRADSHATGAD